MNDIETRLREALAARADLVQPEHLTAPAPEVGSHRWWRRPGPYLLVAATVALVVSVPVVVLTWGGDGDTPAVTDPTTSLPQPTHWWEQHPDGLPERWATGQGVGAGEWLEGDLDGDGTTDQVRFSGSEGNVSLQAEVGGQSLTTPLDPGSAALGPLTTIAGSDTLVIPVATSEGAAGTTYSTWHVYLVRDGEIVEATVQGGPDSPSFGSQVSNLAEAEGGRDTWRTWVDPSEGIVTMSYDDEGTIADDGYPHPTRKIYRNTFYRWSLDGTTLVATELGQGCTVRDADPVTACPPVS